MDWMLFWTAFGAIGGTFGALATAIAVIVALWQTKYSSTKKLKINFTDNVTVMGNSGKVVANFVGLTVINVGNRDLIIERWGLKLNNHREALIFSDMPMKGIPAVIQEPFVSKFPHTLPIEHSVTFYYEKTLFQQIVPEYCQNNELSKHKKITFWVKDSTGQKYYCKSPKKACEYFKKDQK